jgi:aspartate/methionine/tyrosine aminotransferase
MLIHPRAAKLFGESAFEVLRRARDLEAQGRRIVHLEIGQPDFPTPAHICEAAAAALRAGKTGYGPSQGLPELRKAIAEHAGRLRGNEVRPDDVVVTPGGKPILFYTINSLAGEGDEVIYPDPGFPMYQSLIAHAGATPVPLPLREADGFSFDVEQFRGLLSPRTRLVILNSPHNPTGGILGRRELEAVADEARQRGFVVLSDEVYLHFSYDAPFLSIASLPGMAERTVICDSFSKTYSMTGWRVGFGIVPRPLVAAFDLYNVNIVSCTTTFNQYAAVEALKGPQDSVSAMVAEFRRRRDFLVDGLSSIPPLRCVRPGGAFYVFPNVSATGWRSGELARRLLDEAGVAVLAGTAFGKEGECHLRLSYATSMRELEEALRRLREFFGRLHPPG